MSKVTSVLNESSESSEGFEALAGLNDGFLGTGLSTWSEVTIIVTVLIVGYVAAGTVKYYWPGFSFLHFFAGAIGLRNR